MKNVQKLPFVNCDWSSSYNHFTFNYLTDCIPFYFWDTFLKKKTYFRNIIVNRNNYFAEFKKI